MNIEPEELQNFGGNQHTVLQERELQEVRIENVPWSEYLIDQTISCTEERKAVLKRALRKNCQLDQVHIYTDGSLKEDHTGNKRLGYALVQIGTTEENSYKIKGRITNWASSTRAELMAILEALLISPERGVANIYTDSAASIQAIKRIKECKARDWLKKNNTAILKAIRQTIETKDIKVIMHKIKAHSGIRENELADLEAKKGSDEPIATQVQLTQTRGAPFNILWRNIEIENPIRKFIKKINNCRFKSEWVLLGGEKDKVHGDRMSRMCWKFFRRLVNESRKKQGNSIEENNRWIFMIKCINRLLPTLEKRHLFRPDLYKDSLCIRCKSKEESFEHLLECKADEESWINLEKEIIEKLEDLFKSNNIYSEQKNIILRTLFPEETEELRTRRQETLRGFIPKNLLEAFSAIGITRKKTKLILETYVREWLQSFKVKIWRTRCNAVIKWENKIGITRKEKRNKTTKKKKKKSITLKLNKQLEKSKEGFITQDKVFNEIEKWIRTGTVQPCLMY